MGSGRSQFSSILDRRRLAMMQALVGCLTPRSIEEAEIREYVLLKQRKLLKKEKDMKLRVDHLGGVGGQTWGQNAIKIGSFFHL